MPSVGGGPGSIHVPGYEILGELGRGGMGVVYRARQVGLKRLVALKMILAGAQAGAEQLARFRTEAEAVARLQHPHIVQIYEVGERDGLPYFSLEFVDGGSLDRKLKGQPADPWRSAALVGELARAMHAAHQRGIIHRDLKPANILLGNREQGTGNSREDDLGFPKITDFGLAKRLDLDPAASPLGVQTQSGAIMGTPCYMAPEQAAGRISQISPCTDVYALGAILYEMLTGQPPFRGITVLDTLQRVLHDDPTPPSRLQPGVPRDLEVICLKALAKEPRQRYSSALTLAQDLERFGAGEAILARPERIFGKAWRKLRRRPLTTAALLLTALTLAAAGYLGLRVRDAHRQDEANTAFEKALEAREWTEAEARIDDLRRLAPEKAAAATDRLNQRLEEHALGLIQTPRLSPELTRRIEDVIALLDRRDPDAGRRLQGQLRQRLHQWQREFELSAPFQQLHLVLDPARVRIDGAALWRQPAGAEAQDEPLLTVKPCTGNVEMWATFQHASWETASRLGVVLNAARGKGYAFLLTASRPGARTPAGQPPTSFAEARQNDGWICLQICRNGKVLRQRRERAAEFPAGSLNLAATRMADRLTFRVNGLKPVEFQDPFPLAGAEGGVYGFYLPEGVGLQNAGGSRQALAARASPLERGDELFAGGKTDALREALAWYREQAARSADSELGQEARYKQALCQLALHQDKDAEDLIAALAHERGEHWPELARVQLLLLRLRKNQLDEAGELFAGFTTSVPMPGDGLFDGLSSQSRIERLADLVPEETLRQIWQELYRKYSGMGMFSLKPRQADDMARLVLLQDYLDFSARERILARIGLAYTYSLGGRPDEAIRTYEHVLRHDRSALYQEGLHLVLVSEYCTALRLAGQTGKALAVVNEHLYERPGVYRPGCLTLLNTRARIHGALGQWDRMEQDLDELFRQVPARQLPYVNFATAWLLRGFLREQRGDRAGATAAWRAGLFKHHAARLARDVAPGPLGLGPIANAGYGILLGSLADELTDADVDELLAPLVPQVVPGLVLGASLRRDWIPTPVLRRLARSPEGHELARKIAFLDLPPRELMRGVVIVWAVEMMREGAFPEGPSREQSELLWRLAADGYEVYLTGRLSDNEILGQLLPLLAMWNPAFGRTVPLLALTVPALRRTVSSRWEDVEVQLDPRLRGNLAYLFGRRALRLGQPKLARTLFTRALANTPASSSLHRLAGGELHGLSAGKP